MAFIQVQNEPFLPFRERRCFCAFPLLAQRENLAQNSRFKRSRFQAAKQSVSIDMYQSVSGLIRETYQTSGSASELPLQFDAFGAMV